MPKALVVDDEPFIVLLAQDELQLAGFDVESAMSGDDALARLDRDRDWDLLLTDIRMPGRIDGWELGSAARLLVPDLRIIYASGYDDQPDGLSDSERFISKPYEVEDLRSALTALGFAPATPAI